MLNININNEQDKQKLLFSNPLESDKIICIGKEEISTFILNNIKFVIIYCN